MSRRLLNRGGGRATTTTASSSSSSALPDYEPPSFPLNDAARRALGELSNNRGVAPYEPQLKDSVRQLGLSVSDLHERLRTDRSRLDALRARREEKGTRKTAEEERLEAHIPGFATEVEALTRESERALRRVIDKRAELEDEAAILGDLYTNAATGNSVAAAASASTTRGRRRRTNNVPNDDDDDDDNNNGEGDIGGERGHPDQQQPPVPSTLDTFRDLRAKKREEYAKLSLRQRYTLNNDYAGFKKLWHDAAAGEDGPPLPDASRWFLPSGEPDMTTTPAGHARHGGLGGGDDDDDDVAVSRENISVNCPLTLLPMVEPYSNHKCPHTFEKSAILDYLPVHGVGQCPQTGCSQTFSRARFKDDFFLDEVMLRRIQRTKRAEQDMDDDDDDQDHANQSLLVGAERSVRGGGGGSRVMKRETTVDPR